MPFTVLPNGRNQFVTETGAPAVGYKVYAYVAGTSTPKDTYTDYTGGTANTHPIVLDSRGEAAIYWSGTYDVVLKDPAGVTIWGPERVSDTGGLLRNDLSASSGSSLVGFIQAGTGAIARTAQDKMRDVVSVNDFGAVGDGVTDDTAAISTALTNNVMVYFPPGNYKVTSIDVSPAGHLIVLGYGARLVNTAQIAASGVPILRISGTSSTDRAILGLEVAGPRVTGDTTVGTGSYTTTGYPSGIDIKTGGRVLIYDCKSSGSFYAGIEAHYCNELMIINCASLVHGYAGVLVSDTLSMKIDSNDIYDVGSTIITDGYGITASTSYDAGVHFNGVVKITNNRVRNCKRKGIDVHDGVDICITGNTVKGFGNSGIYAIAEDSEKRVNDVIIADNQLYGDTSFVASASSSGIEVGQFGASVTVDSTFDVHDNQIIGLTAAYGISLNNSTTAIKAIKLAKIHDNQIVGGSYTNAVFFNNYSTAYELVSVNDNQFSTTCSASGINARTYTYCSIENNHFNGTVVGGFVAYDTTTGLLISRNSLNGVGDLYSGSSTYDPPNIAAGASTTTNVTVTGAVNADYVVGITFSIDIAGLTLTGYVSAADTVTVVFANNTAGAINLASGTLTVNVQKSY